ncbi:hypothetical protein [Actinoalloteichus hymeniacidonis]|uniref:Uncharacterized protein n=1 Tax=Actinoalloteichus hymeniacidonis TaxID=340345 RepID=A0AAC9HT82_9PSEU|nr:hypothetical protein [Actinoalloteichus hymeniacidonis]AOS65043.1 hypothetical protein TL08_21280 [Actinoalloteichus hymeniacidonis]MBB5906878.1 energy-coupling factor transporter transmembrane protein EcfT [Actinoalloteichus hymeniacidonis]
MPSSADRRARLIPGDGPLSRVPPALAFLVVIALFLLGVWLGGWVGVLLLGTLILLVMGLLLVTWRSLGTGDRTMRLVALLMLVAITTNVAYGALTG